MLPSPLLPGLKIAWTNPAKLHLRRRRAQCPLTSSKSRSVLVVAARPPVPPIPGVPMPATGSISPPGAAARTCPPSPRNRRSSVSISPPAHRGLSRATTSRIRSRRSNAAYLHSAGIMPSGANPWTVRTAISRPFWRGSATPMQNRRSRRKRWWHKTSSPCWKLSIRGA